MTVYLERYKAVDGIQMPRTVVREMSENQNVGGEVFRSDTDNAKYRFNVAFNSTIFEAPIPNKVERNSWQPVRNP